MSTAAQRLGITPLTMRLAFSYLTKGVGRYSISHLLYDEVLVEQTRDWEELVAGGIAGVRYGSTMRVTFYHSGQRVRHIDFSVLCSGGGGEPLFKEA